MVCRSSKSAGRSRLQPSHAKRDKPVKPFAEKTSCRSPQDRKLGQSKAQALSMVLGRAAAHAPYACRPASPSSPAGQPGRVKIWRADFAKAIYKPLAFAADACNDALFQEAAADDCTVLDPLTIRVMIQSPFRPTHSVRSSSAHLIHSPLQTVCRSQRSQDTLANDIPLQRIDSEDTLVVADNMPAASEPIAIQGERRRSYGIGGAGNMRLPSEVKALMDSPPSEEQRERIPAEVRNRRVVTDDA